MLFSHEKEFRRSKNKHRRSERKKQAQQTIINGKLLSKVAQE